MTIVESQIEPHIETGVTERGVTEFDRTTRVRPLESAGRFAVDLDSTWASLRGIHGGYMTSVAVRAAEMTSPLREIRTITTSFLRPGEMGPAELDVDVIRAGRSLSTLAVVLRQAGRAIATTRITALSRVSGHEWSTVSPRRPGTFAAAVPFTPPPSIPHFQHAEFRIDPSTIPESNGDEAFVAGYVRPIEARRVDAAWLAMIGDWFPPSPFRRLVPPAGGVSIDYTVHIHRTLTLGPDEWLEGVFHAGTSVDGLALERGTLSTAGGQPVAETFHTRWTG